MGQLHFFIEFLTLPNVNFGNAHCTSHLKLKFNHRRLWMRTARFYLMYHLLWKGWLSWKDFKMTVRGHDPVYTFDHYTTRDWLWYLIVFSLSVYILYYSCIVYGQDLDNIDLAVAWRSSEIILWYTAVHNQLYDEINKSIYVALLEC